ncbi:MAG TPA: hypothetical protein VLH35_01250 [Candidatus Acidoferrales bacterium]|nr:hypothetical protein [Candidatus Acidoferrales bacterium]
MRERIEAAFEYTIEHPEAIMLLGGISLAFVSVFTATIDAGTTTNFLRTLAILLIGAGIVLYVLHLGLRLIIRFFQKLAHAFDGHPPST